MPAFSKETNIRVRFDDGDYIHQVNVNGGGYSEVNIVTNDDCTIKFSFKTQEQLKALLDMVMTAGLLIDWDARYPSEYVYPNDSKMITREQVLEWKTTAQQKAQD